MARPQKQPGELGGVHFQSRPDGKVLARTTIRLFTGEYLRLGAIGSDEETARAAIEDKAQRAWHHIAVFPDSTIAALADAWIRDLRARTEMGAEKAVKVQTIEQYEITLRTHVLPGLAAVRIDQVTVAYADAFLRALAMDKSRSAANRARTVLFGMFKLAVRHGAVPSQVNPIRETTRMQSSPPSFIELDAGQLRLIRELLADYRGGSRHRTGGPTVNVRVVEDLILLVLGSSMRTGEALGLRQEDVRFVGDDVEVYVGGTMIRTKEGGSQRQSIPKRDGQQRWVRLPGFSADVVRRRYAEYVEDRVHNPDGVLIVTSAGTPYERSNVARMLRGFRKEHAAELHEAGIDVDLLTFRGFRKAAATAVADNDGLEQAAGLLGHRDSSVTERFYRKPRIPVIREAAVALDAVFGDGERE